MATIDSVLRKLDLPLEGRTQKRFLYGCPGFFDWLENDLPNLERGRLNAPDPPNEQLDNWLYRWAIGREIRYDRHFKDLMPHQDEVWEAKMPDLRIFGWMYKPRTFVAVFGDYADLYKGRNPRKSYDAAVRRVVRTRDDLRLDTPKFVSGTFDELVCV